MNKLTWNLGIGNEALFWTNSWRGYEILENELNNPALENLLESRVGIHFRDYIFFNREEWVWKSFKETGITLEEEKLLKETLNKRRIILNNNKDMLVWDGSKNGEYNTRDGYNLIIKQYIDPRLISL